MPKSSADRVANYDAKLNSSILKSRIDAMRDTMIANAAVEFGELENIENAAQAILNTTLIGDPPRPIPTIDYPAYYAFVRKAYSLSKRFSGVALDNAASIFAQTYKSRGYSGDVLETLASQLFGITLTLV